MFPSKNGISSDLVPVAIILGSPNPDHNNLKITLGAYVEVYINNKNIPKQIKVGGVALRPEN